MQGLQMRLPFFPGFISPSWFIQYSLMSIRTLPLKSLTLTYLIFPICKKQTTSLFCTKHFLGEVHFKAFTILSNQYSTTLFSQKLKEKIIEGIDLKCYLQIQ